MRTSILVSWMMLNQTKYHDSVANVQKLKKIMTQTHKKLETEMMCYFNRVKNLAN